MRYLLHNNIIYNIFVARNYSHGPKTKFSTKRTKTNESV
jgi:hypothetical protein